MHQTATTVLKTILLAQPPQSHHQGMLLVDDALVTAIHALQSMVSTMLQTLPGGLVFSGNMFLNIPLLATGMSFLCKESNWSMIHCSMPTRSISTLNTRLVKKFSSMTKHFKANLNQKLQDPLTFSGSILMALWQFACSLVLLNVSMLATPCHIGSPHLCNLIWNPCLFVINYGEGECCVQLCLW